MTDHATPEAYMSKALRCLASAQALLIGNDTEGTCNRAYYAMFNAAHTALLSVEIDGPKPVYKTHSSLIAAFGRHIVIGANIDPELGRSLNRVEQLRLRADYVGDPPPLADAKAAVQQAEAFVAAMQAAFLSGKPHGSRLGHG